MPNRDIGIDVRAPSREPAPGDRLNPFNGSLRVRGSVIIGTVVSNKMLGSCVVEKQHQRLVEKFERYEKRTRRYPAHVPSNIDVKPGDEVVIAECRPISKTVNFVVVENRGNPQAAKLADTKGEPKAERAEARAVRREAKSEASTKKSTTPARKAESTPTPRKAKAEPKGPQDTEA